MVHWVSEPTRQSCSGPLGQRLGIPSPAISTIRIRWRICYSLWLERELGSFRFRECDRVASGMLFMHP